MNCAETEILSCEYVDGTLAPAQRAEVEHHLGECPNCAELARDAAARGWPVLEFAARWTAPKV